jgi:cobalt-zinc-cadmium efflux system membrane fusion protein
LLKVVAEAANPDGILKDGLFGQARLLAAETVAAQTAKSLVVDAHDHDHDHDDKGSEHTLAELLGDGQPATVAVPAGAVQAIDGKSYVFVAIEPDLFELRRVEAGPRRAGEIVIIAGLHAGEKVAASQGFALKSELLKSRLGASCADH